MELGQQIKKYRMHANLSQEELAERIFVTRQSISNWENDKTYPDINSLVLLSEIFQVSLEVLIKGDLDIMKETIKNEEVIKLNRYGTIYSILLTVSLLSAVPLFTFLGNKALLPWSLMYVVTMFYAFKVEKVKKENNVHTYKEIVAFCDGKRLDEIQSQREIGKRPYQKILLMIGVALITFVGCMLIGFLMHLFS